MKVFITLLILFTINSAKGQLNGNCEVEGITENQWTTSFKNKEIDDNASGVIFSNPTKNVASCTGNSKYLNVVCDQDSLTISTSTEFINYEINEVHNTIPLIVNLLSFTCSEGTGKISFYQPINDLNTHKPVFGAPSYTFKLPMPLPESISLQCLYDVEIHACDDDISNLKLDFEVDPPDFLITMENALDTNKRCFAAKITSKVPLNLDKTTEYNLKVKDDGSPLQTGSSLLVIEVDEDKVLISNPQFSSAYYTAEYDTTDNNHKVNFVEIKLIKNYPDVKLSLIGDQKDYFQVDHTEDIVTVTLQSNLPLETIDEHAFIILTLEAEVPKAEAAGRTALIISMPTKECPTTTTSLPTTACPTTESPTECPICTTEQPITTTVCPTTETPTECPPCTTEATTISSCPPCTTQQPTCPTSETPSECTTSTCPPCSTEQPTCPTECPVCSTEGITTFTCPPCNTEQTSQCPVCSTEATTISSCPPCSTEKPTCPTPTDGTTTSTCPPCSTEQSTCPTECPICSSEGTTTFTCPPCNTEQPTCPTECPICSTEEITTSTCPPCSTEQPTCPTECPICSTEGTTTSTCLPCNTEQPSGPTECPISSTEACPTQCPECTTTTCPIECPESTECPQTPTTITPTEPRVIFLENSYSFNVVVGGHVTVGFVKAIAIPEEPIEYKLSDGGNSLPAQFHIDKGTGELTLSGKIDVGDYTAVAHAIGISSKTEAKANVAISAYIDTETEDVLIVHTIDENKSNSLLLPCPNGQTTCIYKYLSHYPTTNESIFRYENEHLMIEPISLEMDQIKNLLNPQFTVNLQLLSDEATETNELIESADDENRHWLYLPEKIPRNSNNLLVSVIIKDVNDHGPVFLVGSKLTIGYPMKSLLNAISPPYLVKVEATDMDKGVNGDIRYTSSVTDIIVHPKTGIVYPGGNAFDGNVNRKFSIVATDMDGQDGGKSATLEIEVVLLSEQHLTILTLNNKALEDVDSVIKELSQEIKLNINYLTASIIPNEQEDSFYNYIKKLTSTKEDQNYSIRMVIYALTLDNKPVLADTLEDSLDEIDDDGSLKMDTWSSPCGVNTINEGNTNTTGYIAAIAVLASLLIIFMVVVAILYYIKIYKKRKIDSYNSMGEQDTDSMKSDKPHLHENDQKPKKRLTQYVYNSPPPEEDDSISDNKEYETIPGKAWSTENSSPIYSDPLDIKVNNEKRSSYDLKLQIDDNIDNESTEISKSVSFKPIVEKYNIVTDAEKEDENEDIRL